MFAPVAQSVELLPFKEKVAGSIPAGRTASRKIYTSVDFLAVRTAAMFRKLAGPRGAGCENSECRRGIICSHKIKNYSNPIFRKVIISGGTSVK